MRISEKQIEDEIVQRAEEHSPERSRILGRQVEVSWGGVIDLLVARYEPPAYLLIEVVELKREKIKTGAVTQVLTYMGAVREAFGDPSDHLVSVEEDLNAKVVGVVAAPKISCRAAHAVNAIPRLEYSHLDIQVTPERWRHINPGDVSEEDREAFRSSMRGLIRDTYPDRDDLDERWEEGADLPFSGGSEDQTEEV